MRIVASVVAILLQILVVVAASAVDGVLEIDQTCAVQAGCFPGDAAGLPVEITQSGSYRLTSNLVLGDSATSGISILADNVSIDLNGFAVRGPFLCNPGNCSVGGAGSAIAKPLLDNRVRTTVHDGVITGAGANCIALGDEARVEGVAISSCGGNGVVVGAHSTVLRNQIVSIRQRGLSLGPDSAFSNNVIALAGLGGVAGVTETVVGGRATGGNVCDDGKCSPGGRHYYMTRNLVPGNQVLTACAANFHMASLWEIHDTTSLIYDTALGDVTDDAGSGPPASGAWIRTGSAANSSFYYEGVHNCNAWTSTSGTGTVVSLSNDWRASNAGSVISPWKAELIACGASTRVWCIQD